MTVKTNDQLMTIYLSSLVRAITAFHDLIDNKIQNRQQQEVKEGKKDETEKKEGEDKKVNGTTTSEADKEKDKKTADESKDKDKKKS